MMTLLMTGAAAAQDTVLHNSLAVYAIRELPVRLRSTVDVG